MLQLGGRQLVIVEDEIPENFEWLSPDLGKNQDTSKKFHTDNQKYLFTYRSHIDKKKLKEWFETNSRFKNHLPFKFFEVAHETGDTGYKHTHLLVDFGQRFKSDKNSVFDYPEPGSQPIHPHIKFVTTITHWNRCVQYLAKEDPENEFLKKLVPDKIDWNAMINDVIAAPNDRAALQYVVKGYQDAVAIGQIRDRFMAPPPIECGWEPHLQWHGVALSINESAPDPRAILLEEIRGGSWSGFGICIDLSYEFNDKDLYTILEKVKNGRMTAQKYKGGRVRYNRPHVVVMWNKPPRVSGLITDRWRISEILEDGSCKRIDQYRLLETQIQEEENKRRGGFGGMGIHPQFNQNFGIYNTFQNPTPPLMSPVAHAEPHYYQNSEGQMCQTINGVEVPMLLDVLNRL